MISDPLAFKRSDKYIRFTGVLQIRRNGGYPSAAGFKRGEETRVLCTMQRMKKHMLNCTD